MRWNELKVAIGRVPAPPCNDCQTRLRCAKQQLACLDFVRYVNLQSWRGRTNREASRARYIRMFCMEDE